jgi:5-methylcytosine-specific restriction enzyme A
MRATPHLCGYPGCPVILEHGAGLCEEHRRLRRAPRRSVPDRGYSDRSWRNARDQFMRAHPDCQAPGCLAEARIAHHIDGSRPNSPGAPNRWSNLAALCPRHHRLITNHPDAFALPRNG